MSSSTREVRTVSTTELYDRWAQIYDTDGNILQKVDDIHLPALLNQALSLSPNTINSPITVTELGAGTGRNTLKLLSPPYTSRIGKINALDLSPKMLEIAQSRLSSASTSSPKEAKLEIDFQVFDALNPAWDNLPGKADIVLSTLVLEHLPISVFFETVRKLLKKEGGVLVLTNMHQEMGLQTQAGFQSVDEEGKGIKVRGESYVYSVNEVEDEAKRWGMEVVGKVEEVGVKEEDEEGLGVRAGKWRGVKVWFGVVLRAAGA